MPLRTHTQNSCLEKKRQVAVRWSSNCVQVGFFSWIIICFSITHLLQKVLLYECRRHPTFRIMKYIHSMLEPFKGPDISHTPSNRDFSVVPKIIWDTTVWHNHASGKYTNNFHRREKWIKQGHRESSAPQYFQINKLSIAFMFVWFWGFCFMSVSGEKASKQYEEIHSR